ncbi:ankyrin repeat domain-containing protein [Wolbachia endosymbiont (group A) of Oxytorus armatus]|uniref:ankyrin repeat domain-containing protein n=1 Tax=Wolbachia endosymbiont (group A) of Oxytorus armatus TaxID=3066211 RepID=UPI003132C8C8
MFKIQYPTDHLKKEGVNSKITESSDEIEYIGQAKEFPHFKRYRRSDVDSESGSRIKRIDVPGDGSCLFWSVTMAYLIPVRNDDALFRQRYEVLFGNDGTVTQNLDHIRGLVRNLGTANYDDTFANLVRNVFRNRVVDHISYHESEFRNFVEGESGLSFKDYLENMRKLNTWGGEPEIRAMSGMLSATISVFGEVQLPSYGNGDIQIQLFHVGAPGKRNHYNFGLERSIVDNDKELAKGLKRVMGKVRPQDFELIQLLIEEAGTEVGTSKQEEDFRSFETRFQSFVDQIPSYLHSVEKAGFFTHFFLGSFSTLLDTGIAEKLNIKKIYFSFDTSKTLKVAIVKNGQIGNAEDAINNIDLFSISEGKRGHQFTVNELESILKENIASKGLTEQDIENRIEEIKNEINGKMESRLVQIYKGKDGIFVNMETKGILDSATSKEFHEIEKGVWSNPEGDIEKLANSDKEAAKESLEGILREISKVHSKYENSLTYDSSAREAAHHGFMVGVFMNFHYRYNLRVYPEQFAGRGYADIILLARGPDRALDSIPIIIELKAGAGTNATPDKALQQAEKYAQGFQPNVQRVLTTADNILCVGVNLDNPSPISDIKVSNRGEEIIPLFQDMLKSADDWDTQRIGTIELKGQVKDNLERIYHTFPGTSEKGDNHYFSRFLLGQSLLLNRIEDLKTGFKKYIFIYGNNIPTEVHPNLRGLGRTAAARARERLSANLDASHAVVTMVLIPENTEKLVYVINIVEANRKDVLNGMNEVLPLDRLNKEIENREIVELNLNFDTRYKSDFKRYLTIWTEKYNSLQEYNNGDNRFQGTFKEVTYPNELKETFDKALDIQSLSIRGYSRLLEKIGEGIFPFKSLVNKEAHFQGILNGAFSYYSDLKLQESPETRALVLTEFQTGRGERIDMLVHGIKFVAQGGNAEEYTPIGLELKASRQGKGAQALLREANDQINEEYKEGVTYKTLTDGDEVKFIGVVFDKGSNNPNKLILTSRTAKEGFIPVEVVHSSVHMLPTVGQCSKRESSSPEYPPSKKPRRERSVNMACIDSFDEEKITEEEKEQRIKELFNADKVAERVKNIEFYDQLFKVSQKISEGEIIDKNVEEAFVAKIKDVDLNSIDPEIRDIVKEMKDNIENKEEVKNILRRSGVAERIGKVAEGAGLAFTALLVGKHIANGDMEGLGYDALNLWVMPKIGEKISGKILELGTKLDSQMLKGFAPVMGRAIGNLAAFLGLAESIKARQSATDSVDIKIDDLNIATNSIFIAADVPAVVTETMSVAGLETGVVGEFAGPVGAAVSVAVIVISQFVEAGLEVEKLTEQMSLTDQEKHDLYWDFFLGKKVPDYIEHDMEAEEIYKQYISKILDQFKNNYDTIAISLPSILVTKEEYATSARSRDKRQLEGYGLAFGQALHGVSNECRAKTRIVDDTFDFESSTNITYPFYTSGIKHNSRIIPSAVGNYNVVCGPHDDNIAVQIVSKETLASLPSGASCSSASQYSNMKLSRTVERWFLQEHMTNCYNAVSYNRNNPSGSVKMLFYMSNNNAFINVTSNYTVDVIFNGKNILLNSYGINNQGSSVQNRYYFTNQLSNCDVHKQGTNFFYIAKDNFVCNLGGSSAGQSNTVITRGNFKDSEDIHSVIGSNEANHIEVSHAGYVDGKGGNDVITAKNFTAIKGYFGDSIYGKGLVLLPINFSDIGSMTHANNITNIYNKSGAFISVDKQTSVKTADGLFVTPTKVDINTDRVTNVHITKLDNKLDNLQKMDNSNFNITKQLLNTNYHGVVGSSSNHIFYPDEDHHNFYWKAPSNISHLYLFDNRNANIMIAQANGILDFSLLNSTLNDMPFIEDNKGEIKINKNGLNVTLLSNYKDVTVTFNGEEYYKLQNGELERDYCSHSLKVDGRFSVNGTNLLNHHNCFTFDSDKVLFLKLNNDLLLLSDRGALSISDYYSSVHKNWDLSIGLNNRVMEPEEFGERADEFSSFRYYQPDEQGLQIYHNQPVNKNDIGLVDLKDKSILDFNMRVMNDTLLLSHKNNTLVKVENWKTYQPAREMIFAFNDAIVSNSKCIASICNSEDVIVEFDKEKLVLSTEQLFNAVRQNNLDKVRELINQGASINAQEVGIYGKKPIHIAAENNNKNIIEFLLSRGVSIDDTERVGNTPLHYAAWRGGLEAAEFLVDRGASINAADNSGKKPVHVAAENNNKNVIEFLLSKGVSVDEIDKNGWTPLHYTARFSQLEAAQLLVDKGANINAQNVYGREAIHIAAEHDNKNIIELLLNKGVSVNEVDKDGWTPLHWASWSGHLDVVEYLIRKGANINAADNSGKRPVHVAAESNNKNIIEFLLSKGENVNDCGDDYWRPLHYAAKAGSLEAAKFLVENGAGFYSKKYETTDGQAPIHIAAYYGHKSIVKFFVVEKGVDINWEDSYRSHGNWWTPLHWASKGGHLDVVEYLVSLGANIDAQDWYRKTPIDIARGAEHTDIVQYLEERSRDYARGKKAMHFAAENNDMENLRFLVSKGENVNDCGDDYWRPLHYAAKAGSLEAAEFLVEKGAGFYSKKYETTDGQAPIHIAAFHGHKNIVKFFVVEKGVDVNWEDGYRSHGNWWTPLHWASKGGRLDVVEYLVSLGANINAQDWYRKTPLDIAIDQKHDNVVGYLKEIKEEREKPVQRNRRYLLSQSLDSSGQPEIAASSGTRPSSWINGLFGWVKGSVGGFRAALSEEASNTASSIPQVDEQFAKASVSSSSSTSTTLPSDGTDKKQENGGFFRDNIDYVNANIKQMRERQTPVKFKPSSGNIILEMGDHYLSQVDFNGTIMLLDLLIRKVTGQKYISTVDQSISPLEAQGYTLNITKGFEKVVEQAGLKSGISMHRLNIDYMGMQKEIIRKVMSGKFNEISGILKSYVEKACPGEEAGKLSPKKFDKFIAQFNKGLLNQSIEQILHNRDGRLEVDGAKQMSLEPQSYLSNASVHSHSEVSTCLSEIGVTKLGGNINR